MRAFASLVLLAALGTAPGAARAGFAWYRAAFSPEGLAQAKMRAAQRLA